MRRTEQSIVVWLLLGCVFFAARQLCAQGPSLTLTNPLPAEDDRFGYAVAAIGSNKMLIAAPRNDTGATNAGIAYLFSTSGAVLTTFTNPAPPGPQFWGFFGFSVAAIGSEKVIIGATGNDSGGTNAAGAAYLFSANGALLQTIPNPSPASGDNFGWSVAASGNDRVIISDPHDDTGAEDSGAVYLFDTNGTVLITITNPAPKRNDWFGQSVAALGTDKLIIGAYGDDVGDTDSGAAYLFNTNGALLTVLTNPMPGGLEWFGYAVAAVGPDKILVGAYYAFPDSPPYLTGAGAAYLFNTNGTLLTTFRNPTPADTEFFAISVAAVGDDKVLIGAVRDQVNGTQIGAAYLFSTNGALLNIYTNPTPTYFDYFGNAVTAVGSDKVLIASRYKDIGATDAGAAYVFEVRPSLAISKTTTNTLLLSWASVWGNYALQQNSNLNTTNWTSPLETVADDGTTKSITANPSADGCFYRLVNP